MEPASALQALIQFRKGEGARAGPDRLRLLLRIRDLGSIKAAAAAEGLSYKGAWDAVRAMNNLFSRPVVQARAGGAEGGTASVTPAGLALIEAHAQMAQALSRLAGQLDLAMAGDGPPIEDLSWSLRMKTSARNALRGVVTRVTEGAVNAEVALSLGEGLELIAVITRESVAELALAPGREAVALIKASFVILAPGEPALRTSARNQLAGVVARHITGAVNDEVVLDLDHGKSLTATLTRESAQALGLKEGARARALIKASHIILAVD